MNGSIGSMYCAEDAGGRIQPALVRAYVTSTIIGFLLLILSVALHLENYVISSVVVIAASGAALLSLIVSAHLQRRKVHGLVYVIMVGILFIGLSIGIYACVATIVDLIGGL